MLTYNGLLYTERNNRGLSRIKMAKLLHIFPYTYKMIECGYIKPTKKQVAKISKALEIDYSQYLVGEPSYPCELPEKKRNKVVAFFYKVLGTITFKIIFAVLAGLSVGFMVSGFAVEANIAKNKKSYFSEEYLNFVETLKANGSLHISVTSRMTAPEYRSYEKDEENKTSKYISVVGSYDDTTIGKLTFTAIYRNETSRLVYTISTTTKDIDLVAKYTEYESAITYSGSFFNETTLNGVSYIDGSGKKNYYLNGEGEFEKGRVLLSTKLDEYLNDFNSLISEKDHTFAVDIADKLHYLIGLEQEASKKMGNPILYAFFGRYFGIILSGLNIFILAYALLYGTTRKGEKIYKTAKFDVAVDEVSRMKTDIKFTPFIPETILEIVGILLVFIGSFRLVFYTSSVLTGNSSAVIGTSTGTELMQTFMVGMFLLYFVDFDIFMDDKRVLRNIVLYSVIFFCLYGLENLIYRVLDIDSIVGQLSAFIAMPNMFGSIAGYYCIMLFLFFTPKFIKKKWQLIVYRCLSIIPAVCIFVSWYLYNGYNVLFSADWPRELRNLFNAEKIPFSILAISYLFGLYLMRLFFVWRYGKDRATTFFNGNKFLWIKNIMVSLIIIVIGIVEVCLKDNPTAHKLGLGMYWNILFLIPLLLFYHPHKGPRNIILDWTTLFFYIIAISFAYVAVILMVLEKLFL